MEGKEVAERQATTPTIGKPLKSAAVAVSSNDIEIPKILLMQAQSDFVKEEIARGGDFVETLGREVIASKDGFEFIPLHMETVWVEYVKNGVNKQGQPVWEYSTTYPVCPDNDNQPWYTDDIKRVRTSNFYVILPHEIDAGYGMPYVISFKSSNKRAGNSLAALMYARNKAAGKECWQTICHLSSAIESNGDADYFVMRVKPLPTKERKITPMEDEIANGWFDTITAGKVKVHSSGDDKWQEEIPF